MVSIQFINLHVHHLGKRPNGTYLEGQTTGGTIREDYSGGGGIYDGGSWHDIDGCAIHQRTLGAPPITARNMHIFNNSNCGILSYGRDNLIYNNIIESTAGLCAICSNPHAQIYNNTGCK